MGIRDRGVVGRAVSHGTDFQARGGNGDQFGLGDNGRDWP